MNEQSKPAPKLARAIALRATQILITLCLWVGAFAAGAGTWAWPRLWIYVGVTFLLLIGNFVWVYPRNPAIIAERSRRHEGTKAFDKVIAALSGVGYIAVPVVAGVDAVRFSWSAPGLWSLVVGLSLLVLGGIPVAWALGENPFLEPTVRLQEERGHHVVTTGPYAIVRHPMYVGLILQHIGGPLTVGSLMVLPLSGLMIALLIIRTSLEDRALRAELEGYESYATKTRFRLLPGVW